MHENTYDNTYISFHLRLDLSKKHQQTKASGNAAVIAERERHEKARKVKRK